MNFTEFDKMYSPMNGNHDVSKEQLGISLAPSNDATGITGMSLRDGKCGAPRVGVDSYHLVTPQRLFKTQRTFCISSPL